ncbi:aspartate dehydrogenase [Methanobrevibacter sp. DSM 116169]|uniref:aspartate dehydrogenase n=1 Tax=Methanobrevibacter sp. DSM 116169 TaxID=3242727 RepID=UPI0038FC5A2D
MKIGILGCGAIANIVVSKIMTNYDDINLSYFFDNDIKRAEKLASMTDGKATSNFDEMIDNVDLILEAASAKSVEIYASQVLKKGKDIIIMSIGSLMDNNLRENLIKIAKDNNAKIHAPSGAILGLDGIKAVADLNLTEATLITRKSPESLGRDIKKEEVLFEGKASEAVKKFPANINVAAAISLSCKRNIDVKIIADPLIDRNIHEIYIKGEFGEFSTKVMNLPCDNNPKTSILSAYSAINLLKNLNSTFSIGN